MALNEVLAKRNAAPRSAYCPPPIYSFLIANFHY